MSERESAKAARSSSPRGARSQRTVMRSRFSAWARHHRAMCLDSAGRLIRTPIASLLTMLAIAIALTTTEPDEKVTARSIARYGFPPCTGREVIGARLRMISFASGSPACTGPANAINAMPMA